jgi:hypothetical protein
MSDETYIELLKLAHEKIASLEKVLSHIEHAVRNENELLEMQKNQDVRDLEQQAKGVKDFVFSIEGFSEGYIQALKEGK